MAPPAEKLTHEPRCPGLRPLDEERLQQARRLAEGSFGLTDPNPRVGCVIGLDDGQVLAEGATQQAGGPHAEVMALRDAAARVARTRGATAWVTLEPCAHHGRTPPCCDALVEAGIARVVIGSPDPFPQVNGAGIERLRAAGVQVDVAEGAEREACRELNIGFFSRVERGRPWVRLKVAASVDGCTAPVGALSMIGRAPPCPTGKASGSPARPPAATGTRGGGAPAPCSPAWARCWLTTPAWTCA